MEEVKTRVALIACLCAFAFQSHAQEYNGAFRQPASTDTDRIIVKWKAGSESVRQQKLQQLAAKSGTGLHDQGKISARLDVLRLERRLSGQALWETIRTLSSDPNVEFVAPDLRRYVHTLPNDPLVSNQWYLLGTEVSALRAESAWDVTTGSAGTVVAVLDTGVRFDHPDLLAASASGKLLPGYDFVSGETSSSFVGANDGDGRDANPIDPGDWVSESDRSALGFENCELSDSSWHGTRVAGVIAAKTNNSAGMAGVSHNTWILPVRVMGKCGGRDSDIMAAMRWAAGLSVAGVPNNPYPAKVINLSLGGSGACTAAYQSVASELAERGVLVVASAGNEGGPVSAPANCAGVLGVTGVRHIGTKVGFSNLGPSIGIAAPGGNCVSTGAGQPCLFSIITATNLGSTVPTSSSYTDQFNFNVGTSFSAPMVSGTAALMHAVNAKLGTLQLIERLQQSAMPFPANPNLGTPTCHVPAGPGDIQNTECYCTTSTCGAGLLNASGAVNQAVRPVVSIQLPAIIAPGQNATLDAAASAASCNRTIASYEWTVVSSSGAQPALSSTNQPATTVQAPASGQFVLRVTVTDNTGAQDSAEVTVTSTSASTTATPLVDGAACPTPIVVSQTPNPNPNPTPPNPSTPSGGGGGGGGSFGLELLVIALLGRRKIKRCATASPRR
jgi:serine protease